MSSGDDFTSALAGAFPGLGPGRAERLSAAAVRETIETGQVVLVQKGANDSLFLIVDGEVLVQVEVGGATITVGSLARSQWFGELGFMGSEGASASIVAQKTTRLLRIPRASLLAWLDSDPDLAGALLGEILPGMCHRLRETRGLVDRGPAQLSDSTVVDQSFGARVWRALFGGVR